MLLGQGTMEQLVLSVLLAAAMLAITATLRPYKNIEDDSLSIICQSAVVANLAVAIQLHSMRAGFALERLNLAIVHQTDRAFYVQQLRVLKGRQDVAEDTLFSLPLPCTGYCQRETPSSPRRSTRPSPAAYLERCLRWCRKS